MKPSMLRTVALFTAVLSIRLAADAAPSLSGASGTFSTGQTIQISGTGFGTKSPAAPYVWADFENGLNPSPLGQKTAWDGVQALGWSTEGYQGTHGAKATDGNGNWSLRSNYSNWTNENQHVYIYKKQKVNFLVTSTTQNWKIWRMWPSNGTNYPNIYIAAHNGRCFVENIGQESGFWGDFSNPSTNWNTEEIIFKASSAINVKDGTLTYRLNGTQKTSGTVLTRSSAAPDYMTTNYVVHQILANASQWSPGWSANNRVWVDDVYVDTTWSRVMIGDASTFAASRTFDIQIPTAWSDGSVTTVANTNSFASGSRAYVYVFDKDNNVNANGYAITIGQGGTATNTAPSVNVGADQAVTLGQTLNLSPAVSDDGLPNPPASLTYAWSQVSGPAAATIPSSSSKIPGAISFPVVGQYVLRLTVSDGALSTSDDVIANVSVPVNAAPSVNVGVDKSVVFGQTLTLGPNVSDDGLPNPPGALTYAWTQVSGPAAATIPSPATNNPGAISFPAVGQYDLRLTVSDGALSTSDDVIVTVAVPVNTAPLVNVGADKVLTLGQTLSVSPTVSDDGLPNPPAALTYTWSQVLGPTAATIPSPSSKVPGAISFPAVGQYTLRLTVSDGGLSAFDEMNVNVQPVNTAPVVSAGGAASVTAGAILTVTGVVTDDGLPNPPALTTVAWTVVSGPSVPTISEPAALTTDVRFLSAGTYVLRLTANDGSLSSSATKTITVTPAIGNVAPLVSAGSDITVTLPDRASLAGSVTDDGLPAGSAVTSTWSKVAGPGNVGFGDITAPVTWAEFSQEGIYTLQLTASDGSLSTSDLVMVTVNAAAVTGGATPSVASVSGRLLPGGTLNITGANFGNKNPAAPYLWSDFETGLEPSPLSLHRAFDETQNMVWSTEGFGGTRGVKAVDGSGVWTMRVDYNDWTRDGQKAYIYKKQKANFLITSDTQNWKTWRMWPSSFGYPDLYAAANNGRVFVENIGVESGFTGSFRGTTTDWATEETIFQASSAIDKKDGLLVFRDDGLERARGSVLTRSSAAPALMSLNYVVHAVAASKPSWSPAWSDANRIWVDDLYVDTTWSRVMIGEAPTYAACHNLEIQIPTAWSNNSITVTARSGRYAKGTRVYLYVFDQDGHVNTDGYPLAVDTSGVGSLVDGGTPGETGADAPVHNVFNPAKGENANLTYVLKEKGSVKVIIFDRSGHKVKELTGDERLEGQHTIAWDGRNDDGSTVASGIYIAVAKGSEGSHGRQKIAVIK